ncbi:UDP-glucose:undecaprenyl-phosphate glucose-1-phosphate transferase [Pseudobythopirellula maris]|uniref:UDP-glucose:undecaprenyl-phosphate glucose-1-phosphate transferase n=1 Tax=Pseudobythopirellula maris TaxID=2527991 RepID=A0A5C5ZMS7_9BACT|nr:undecaprenyl-phosphate glucose phosphotransferase [Pseudobythopirellula maris]TWT88287.1 UDP-glucose:undecaprenyl-phosphate glucose-1-phosphate transferase [Pseudobythopirellula maris]
MPSTRRSIRQHHPALCSLHRAVDAAAIALMAWLAVRHTPVGGEAGHSLVNEQIGVAAVAILAHFGVSELTGLYRSWRGARLRGELGALLLNWCYAAGLTLALGLVTGANARFAYESKIAWAVGAPALMLLLRFALRKGQRFLQARGVNTRRVAICGLNDLGVQLARNLAETPQYGLKTTGFYDDRNGNDRSETDGAGETADRLSDLPEGLGDQVGTIDDLVAAARTGEVETVYLTFPMRAEERLRGVLARLSDTTADVYVVPDFFVFELLHARLTDVGGLPAVSIHENPLCGADGLAKRAADLVAAALLLVLLAGPMAVIAAAIKLTSRGPVFFRQKRYGLDGREILVWKFRSMRTDLCENGPVVKQATQGDSRITPLGAVLRKTSLDELPQLLNVIGGSMSLVGPRPHATAHNEQYRTLIDGYMLRHKVKPGITGLAQVMGYRGETETLEKMEGRVRYDKQYIRDWSLWMDLKILFRTVGVVLRQENAY